MKQVQTISQVANNVKENLTSEKQTLPSELQNASPLEQAIKKHWPTVSDIFTAISPNYQGDWVKYPDSAFRTNLAPTLLSLDRIYGEKTSGSWIMAEITDLSEFCDCKEKLTTDQIENVSDLIAAQYKHFKMSEFLLFFGWMKLGKYGDFYGKLSPIRITTALNTFKQERESYLLKIDYKSIV